MWRISATPEEAAADLVIVKAAYNVGDILYIKETWQAYSPTGVSWDVYKPIERAMYEGRWSVRYRANFQKDDLGMGITRWNSSRFMPRVFSRYFVKIEEVEMQHLWQISDQDARAEGIRPPESLNAWQKARYDATEAFRILWDSINKANPYDTNPQVWRYKFTYLEVEE